MKTVLLIIVFLCGTLVTDYARVRQTAGNNADFSQRKSRVMGSEVKLVLFNRRIYKEQVLPAYDLFLEKGNDELLVKLLRECIKKLDSNPRLAEELLWNQEIIEEDIGIISGTVFYSPDGNRSNQDKSEEAARVKREYARELLASNILQVLCVPYEKGLNPAQDMTNTPLTPYLYGKSEWIKDVMTFARRVHGKSLELSLGESSETLNSQDIREFIAELDKTPRPHDPDLGKEFDNLRAILSAAGEDPDLMLVLSIS